MEGVLLDETDDAYADACAFEDLILEEVFGHARGRVVDDVAQQPRLPED